MKPAQTSGDIFGTVIVSGVLRPSLEGGNHVTASVALDMQCIQVQRFELLLYEPPVVNYPLMIPALEPGRCLLCSHSSCIATQWRERGSSLSKAFKESTPDSI